MKVTALFTSLVAVALTMLRVPPLAAVDVTYKITVETDTREDAGTDANVSITLGPGPVPTDVAGCEAFPEHLLNTPGNGFERGQTDVFRIIGRDLLELPWICLRHDNAGNKPGWFVTRYHPS
jgi:lipoxygenase homology domain-containing protein 1